MINKKILRGIIDAELKGTDKFLVDILVKRDNKIFVFIDSDTDLTIQDCIDMTRAIESRLDRDKEDFELMVSSPGLEYPLVLKRQYYKNTGRSLKIKLKDESILEGKLIHVDDDGITIEKNIKKKKNKLSDDTVQKLSFDQIDEAKVQVSFK